MDNKVTTAVNGIKSKARVQKHGEVFTPDSIVCDMHDGVTRNLFSDYKEDYEKKQLQAVTSLDDYIRDTYIEETYLEPTCGDGQFLIRILDKKLEYVNKVPVERREIALVQAVSTIYGIDIQADNVAEARARLENYLFNSEVDTFDVGGKGECRPFNFIEGIELTDSLKRVISNIIHNNIIVGNMLQDNDNAGNGIKVYDIMIPRIVGYEFSVDGDVLVEICKLTDMMQSENILDTGEFSNVNSRGIPCKKVCKCNYKDIPVVKQYEPDETLTYKTVDECEKAYNELIKEDKDRKEQERVAEQKRIEQEKQAKAADKKAKKLLDEQRKKEEAEEAEEGSW